MSFLCLSKRMPAAALLQHGEQRGGGVSCHLSQPIPGLQ